MHLKTETATYESNYLEVLEMVAEYNTCHSCTKNKDEAVYFIDRELADTYLAKGYKRSFFKNAEVI